MLDNLLNLFAPHYCIICNKPQKLLCGACQIELTQSLPDVCYRCNSLSPGCKTCRSCRSSSPIFSLHSLSRYDSTAKKLLLSSKLGCVREGFKIMGRVMSQELPHANIDLVSSIPTASSRVRRRGFDHGKMLASHYALLRGLRFERILMRNSQSRQLGANRTTRQQQMKDAFSVRSSANINGKSILLIDDVISTSATLEAASAILKKHGAKRVYAAVLAKNDKRT